jgi:hypothetical protein
MCCLVTYFHHWVWDILVFVVADVVEVEDSHCHPPHDFVAIDETHPVLGRECSG